MNKKELDILYYIFKNKYTTQREIAEQTGCSLGTANVVLKKLEKNGYISKEKKITLKGERYIQRKRVHNAIILAAGYGMRMAPINMEIPKAFLEVKGEKLIERLIMQLREVQIEKIYIVVGFMKEKFEYLIDKYGVELIINEQYSLKNSLHSLFLAKEHIENAYVIPADLWCEKNPFDKYEMNMWYMVKEEESTESTVKIGSQGKLVTALNEKYGNKMIGISYLDGEYTAYLKKQLEDMEEKKQYYRSFWEEILFRDAELKVWAKKGDNYGIWEINTYEELRDLDNNSVNLDTEVIKIICHVFDTKKEKITDIKVLKKGMTNRSFLFRYEDKMYIMRIPGEGTGRLIDRNNEYNAYQIVKDKGICDDIVYLNAKNGYKISRFVEKARTCDPKSQDDVVKCMKKLKKFHDMNLKVEHTFDLFEKIEFYENLWGKSSSIYCDYETTKKNVLALKHMIDVCEKKWCLTHIDAIPDNFLIYSGDNEEEIRLIDWEYAGMQDPHVDLAMFGIYAGYEKKEIDDLLQIYFEGQCDREIRIKIYCYIAVCGLLWSNWCEYKSKLGIEFGVYALKQYRYAKDFYNIVCNEIGELNE